MLAPPLQRAPTVTLAIFDLDNTLIGGDSDYLWGCFVCERGLVNAAEFGALNDQFYADYQRGSLDMDAYLRFALAPLVGQTPDTLASWHRDFMASKIEPIILPSATELIERHRQQGHDLLIVTATNHFITRPIADALGIDELIASEGEMVGGRYTGEPRGVPSYREGKVTRVKQWLTKKGITLSGSYFYSDSHNDLPLLDLVDHPVAVDPDAILLAHATAEGWSVISLRD